MRPSSTLSPTVLDLPCYIAGEALDSSCRLEVFDPYTDRCVGTVAMADRAALERAVEAAHTGGPTPTRYDRHRVLTEAGGLLASRQEAFARLICSESGLCIRETRYEVGRTLDVLRQAAAQALIDDGQTFSGDISATPKARKVFTLREPLRCVAAITPFNHPLNQVAHKLAPAIAAGAPVILKPSDKTPLTAIRFAELLYEAGLPGWMLSVILGRVDEVVEPLVRHERVELVAFTGSVAIGKHIAATAGYKKLCLELGGNSPLIVLDDADLDLAVTLAAEGSYRNSGQRCTAVKRMLVHRRLVDAFTERLVQRTAEYTCGDPTDEATRVGTVIDEPAAVRLQRVVADAVARGARVLIGGQRRGAQIEPTVIADVPRDAHMVVEESFGPLSPIMPIDDLDDAIDLANATAFGLSTSVVTRDLSAAIEVVKRVRTGSVNINEVPGWRVECAPFGGLKDSGLAVKEGVIEAMKLMTAVKTFSLPW